MITKAVIPIAGYGTRLLPFSKAVPKQMATIVNKPALQYLIEIAAQSGIKDIVFITSAHQEAVQNHFNYNYELETKLKESGKEDLAKEIHQIADLANFSYIPQKEMLGNGHAVLCAKSAIGKNPFIVNFADELMDTKVPYILQMIQAYEQYKTPIMAAVVVEKEDISKYGIINGKKISDRVWLANNIIEKPQPDETESRLASTACYVLTPEFFSILENLKPGKGGEIWLADAFAEYMKNAPVHVLEFDPRYRFDTGNVKDYVRTFVHFSEKNPETKGLIKKFLENEENHQKITL